jgi:hypothetical protein
MATEVSSASPASISLSFQRRRRFTPLFESAPTVFASGGSMAQAPPSLT